MKRTHVLQPKLNEERACLAVLERGHCVIQSRRGGWFPHAVNNRNAFKLFNPGALFDGGVFEGNFFPFETIATGDGTIKPRSPVELRIEHARQTCAALGIEWLFAEPTDDWLIEQASATGENPLTRQWEGWVGKMKGSPYRILKAEHQQSPEWTKLKWV